MIIVVSSEATGSSQVSRLQAEVGWAVSGERGELRKVPLPDLDHFAKASSYAAWKPQEIGEPSVKKIASTGSLKLPKSGLTEEMQHFDRNNEYAADRKENPLHII
uniref:Uncharacterized protein n=1 Tax=Angiostrongylus cantonensis TaxID=6313 RepID=A0A0K0DFZ2_ANGCA